VSIQLDESQRAALDMITGEPISIITGGPGTGKTTILATALKRMQSDGEFVRLAAPTGKAAKRMSEATGAEAVTIHRLLGWNPAERAFYYSANNPIDCDVVVIDESSMVDVKIFASLLDAIDETRTRLVLVGDANQLPSVGPGAILADLVKSELIPCARLTNVHRSAAESWICTNAPRILSGEALDLEERTDFIFKSVDAAPNIPKFAGDIGRILRERLGALALPQILVPQKTGKAGAEEINQRLQARFNPLIPGTIQWGFEPNFLRVGDPVIHTKNDYNLGVFNGECGTVASIDARGLRVKYADRQGHVTYTKADARQLKLSYALTIHKSQGSEWPWVIVIAHSTHSYMLTRQLLYTAITRGKKGVCIVGDERGIAHALKSKRDTKRNTALCERIMGEL